MRQGMLRPPITDIRTEAFSKIPDNLSFEAAATIPDNFVCAFYTLFNQLSLPMPLSLPASEDPPLAGTPILIYGAGSTAGQYMIRVLHLARYTNIIATASAKHHEYLRGLGATHISDYRSSTLTEDINSIVGGSNRLTKAVDCISAMNTMSNIANVLDPTGSVALLLPVKKGTTLNVDDGSDLISNLPLPDGLNPFGKEINVIGVRTFYYHEVRRYYP
jgi:NADPH:quinone reductase-like Zn-dependent oxidoreductase